MVIKTEIIRGALSLPNSIKDIRLTSNKGKRPLTFSERNRRAFWKALHPRKGSDGCWLAFSGPEMLRGICDPRWVGTMEAMGGIYSKEHIHNGKKWTEWLWDAEVIFHTPLPKSKGC